MGLSMILAASSMSCSKPISNNTHSDFIDQDIQSLELFNGTKHEEAPSFIFGLQHNPSGVSFCQATRIAERFILTAAHCIPSNMNLSHLALFQVKSGNQMVKYSSRIIQKFDHPKYEQRIRDIQEYERKSKAAGEQVRALFTANPFDLAILKVDPKGLPKFDPSKIEIYQGPSEPIPLRKNPVDMPQVTLWSFKYNLDMYNFKLNEVRVSSIELIPGSNLGWLNHDGIGGFMYARRFTNQPICPGDSGAALLYKQNSNTKVSTIIGVASSGTLINDSDDACIENARFATVNQFARSWIQSILSQN
jgi:hypothetical protein